MYINNEYVYCHIHRFFVFFYFLRSLWYISIILPLLLIPSWVLAIAHRLPIDCLCLIDCRSIWAEPGPGQAPPHVLAPL